MKPLLVLLISAGCALAADPPLKLLTGSELRDWKVVSEIKDHGPVTLKDGVLSLGEGKPLTGVAYTGKAELPVKDYEVSFEARRVSGEDFFAALTFPVRGPKTFATFIVGGWGGKCVGISSIQYQSADENDSTSWVEFTEGRWYRFRLEVRENRLRAWIDDKQVFDVDTTGKAITMRFGDIEFCEPLGLASYATVGEVRNLVIKKLPAQ
jgi:hypothetical protein